MKKIEVGSDFSGVGAFDYALKKLNINYKTVFACDMDKFARQSYTAAHGEPIYYPKDVYEREIPSKSLGIYMTSPPCQGFSVAGKREGSILFFNSHEFIKKNKPRYFIFENVKGLISHEDGNTFNEWVNMLGGKSVNGLPILFPCEDSVPYHIYWKVLNAKKHGVPQNRERVFIIGIRDDEDNSFTWPKEMPLTRKLKDILEPVVDEKYFLSDKMVSQLLNNGKDTDYLIPGEYSNTIRCGGSGSLTEKHAFDMIKIIGNTNPSGNGMNGNVFDENGISPTLSTNKGEGIKIKSATKSGYETATDIIQLNNPKHSNDRVYHQDGCSPTLNTMQGGNRQPFCCIPVLTPDRPNKRQNGRIFKTDGEPSFTLTAQDKHGIFDGFKIRRLTPLECFRLMAFPDSHVENCKSAGVSDSQLYKQAGNSIVVDVLAQILDKLKLY